MATRRYRSPHDGRAPRRRAGVSLLETLLAIAILGGAVLSAGAYFTRFIHSVSDERTRSTAMQLAAERLEQVKTATSYAGIDALYAGVEPSVTGYSGFARRTDISRVGGQPADSIDYKIVTVTVTTPAIRRSVVVKKSLVVSEF
jgi:Tfp pilus assembly protein PilV